MAMFATVDDLADRLQVDFDTDDRVRATRLLESATGLVQRATRQQIELVTDDSIVLHPTDSNLLVLPELPVVSVTSVTVQDVALTVDTQYLWTRSGLLYAMPERKRWRHPATVVYTHGYATIPDDIVAIVTEVAARAWQNPRNVLSEQIGTYSARYPVASFGLAMSNDEKELLAQYRPVPG